MNIRLKEIRTHFKMSQEEFGKRIGIESRAHISALENGNRTITERIIKDVCREFNVNEQWLRTGEGEPFRERPLSEEVGYYVEDLLDYEGHGNPFYDAIIEMMKEYTELDEKSQAVIREYFRNVAAGINEKQDG